MKCVNTLISTRQQREGEVQEYRKLLEPLFHYPSDEWYGGVKAAMEKCNHDKKISVSPLQNKAYSSMARQMLAFCRYEDKWAFKNSKSTDDDSDTQEEDIFSSENENPLDKPPENAASCDTQASNLQSLSLGITSELLSKYFDYLENRCLKHQDSQQAYIDLFEIRLLFYVPCSIEILQSLTLENLDEESLSIVYSDIVFPIPRTFIRLAKSLFPKGTSLFKKNCKSLNKFVSNSAKAIDLQINLKLIKRSLSFICHQEQFFPHLLPRR